MEKTNKMELEMYKGKMPDVLAVIDMVNGFVKGGNMCDPYVQHIIAENVKLTKAFLEAGKRVIFVREVHGKNCAEFKKFPEHCVAGTWEAELIDELKVFQNHPNAIVVDKNNNNAALMPKFQNEIKKVKSGQKIVFTGVATDICVQESAITTGTLLDEYNIEAEIIAPTNAMETYNIPGVHERDEWNQMAYRFMKQKGVKVVKGLELTKLKDFKTDKVQAITVNPPRRKMNKNVMPKQIIGFPEDLNVWGN